MPQGVYMMFDGHPNQQGGGQNPCPGNRAIALGTESSGIEFGMFHAIKSINIESNHHPDDQPDPGIQGQKYHHEQAGYDAQNGDQGNQGSSESPGGIRYFGP